MKVKNEISEELRSLSMVIEAISRDTPQGTPYVVPLDYFRDFPGQVMSRISGAGQTVLPSAAGEVVLTSLLPEKGDASPFQVPEGYFEGLAGGILDRIKRGQSGSGGQSGAVESGDWKAPVAGEVAEELARISPLLSGIDRKTPYWLPEGYFNELAPILAGLQDKALYEVPEGYFDGLAGEIAARVKQPASVVVERPAPARVVPMGGGKRGWWKYSAAAVVAGLLLTIGWLRLHTSGHGGNVVTPDIANNLAKVSDQDIQTYLDSDNDNISTPLAEVVTNSTATLDMDDNDVKSLLGDVPDGELKQYMEEHGGAKDIATN